MKKILVLGFFVLSGFVFMAANKFVPKLFEKERTEVSFEEEKISEGEMIRFNPSLVNGTNSNFHKKWKIVKVYYKENGKMKVKIDSTTDGKIHYIK